MWVYVYHNKKSFLEDSVTKNYDIRVYPGQYLYLTGSGTFLTYDYDADRWRYTTAYNTSETAVYQVGDNALDGTGTEASFVRRLHQFNCHEYGSDFCDGVGSYYSVRSNLNVYDDAGNLLDTISTDQEVRISYGYGYTKSNQHLTDDFRKFRVRGNRPKAPAAGPPYDYPKTAWAYESVTALPSQYKINTL